MLRDLYVGGSRAGRADVRLLRAWTARGLRGEGLRTQVLELRVVSQHPGRLVIRVADRLVAGEAVGGAGRTPRPPGRPGPRGPAPDPGGRSAGRGGGGRRGGPDTAAARPHRHAGPDAGPGERRRVAGGGGAPGRLNAPWAPSGEGGGQPLVERGVLEHEPFLQQSRR